MSTEVLFKAANDGDVRFLKYANEIIEDKEYLARAEGGLNILHVAAANNKIDFIKKAIEIIPLESIHGLLEQRNDNYKHNPLHTASKNGHVEVVNLILCLYGKSSPVPDKRPWLAKDSNGDTPYYLALKTGNQDCANKILKKMETVDNDDDYDPESHLETPTEDINNIMLALTMGENKTALELLADPSCTLRDGDHTALHLVAHCSEDKDLFERLLRKDTEQVDILTDVGFSVLHYWATVLKLWPFEHLLRSTSVIPNIKKKFQNLMCKTDRQNGYNPLHILAADESSSPDAVKIAKYLIDNCQEEESSSSSSNMSGILPRVLQMKDKNGHTPLFHAINQRKDDLANHILLKDINTLKETPYALFDALHNGYDKLAQNILDIVLRNNWTNLLTNEDGAHIMHFAPLFTKEVYDRLISDYAKYLKIKDKEGATILHHWVTLDVMWPYENLTPSMRTQLVPLLSVTDKNFNSPFHKAAKSSNENAKKIIELLVKEYIKETPNWSSHHLRLLPMFSINYEGYGALDYSILNQNEELALYFLSLLKKPISQLFDCYPPEHNILFLSMENKCYKVAREIITKLDKPTWSKYVTRVSDNSTILHLAPGCQDQEFGIYLVEEAIEFINQNDDREYTPLDEASDVGAAWIIKPMLQKHSDAYKNRPLAWVHACKKGHIQTVSYFIDNYPGNFADHCIDYKQSPLHHIKLPNLSKYEEFLNLPRIKDLINIKDSNGDTPLHKAIKNEDIYLTEALLNMDNIQYLIKNHENKTARVLLRQKHKKDARWRLMCEAIGFDPTIKTTYFQNKTALLDVRSTLALVAALLATITFTAGFTVPGGLDQSTGFIMLVKKPAFLVFLISDTLAMCCSMSILILLVWSMIYDPNKSLVFIDRSMKLLVVSLMLTLLAFMTGVYVIVSPKKLWPAILVIIMCSIPAILTNLKALYTIRDILIRKWKIVQKYLCRRTRTESHENRTQLDIEEGINQEQRIQERDHPRESL